MKKKYLVLIMTMMGVTNAFAECGEKTACTITSVQQPYYYGTASCVAYVSGSSATFSQQFSHSYSQSVTLWGDVTVMYNNQPTSVRTSCSARVPNTAYETVNIEQCKYKPIANFVANDLYGQMQSKASDCDGTIVRHDWWFNGVKQSSTSSSASYTVRGTQSINVKLTVTDNDGYQHSLTKTVTISDDECKTTSCRNR